jgi:ketosteroid isomerase-like protein
MNRKLCLTVLLCSALSLAAFCQTPHSSATKSAAETPTVESSAPDAAALTQLLKDFLQGASSNDIATHERFWAEDLIYTSALGRRRTKNDIRHDLAKENSSEAKNEQTTYSGEDIRIHQYGTTAIVAFELIATTNKDGKTETTHYLNTGTFLKRDGKWQVVAWQATKISPETGG